MGDTTWTRVRSLAEAAGELEPDERARFLERECADDPALRREVESLVAAGDAAPPFLDGAALTALGTPSPAEALVGERAGRWRLEAVAGVGGMGVVYRAVDDAGAVVALKVIKAGLDTEALLARFAAERETLAGLDHPGIVALLDAGALPDGRPWLAVEWVDGVPIDAHCRERALGVPARLALFRTVCDAVQAAHARLVVHRDLKPGNVLVTADGRAKLCDFGVAKLLDPARAGETLTRTGRPAPFTPRYASPEQREGTAITTASDVYALGVLFTDLLPPEVRRPGSDLERVLAKARREEPARRYATVEALSDELGRVLEGRPVRARPDSWAYRASRFVRRNRAAVALGAVALASLVVAAVSTARGLSRARAGEALAWRAHAQALTVAGAYQRLFTALDRETLARDADLPAALESIERSVARDLADQPEAEGRVRMQLAFVYGLLERWEEAVPELERAQALADAHRGFGQQDRAWIEARLAEARARLR